MVATHVYIHISTPRTVAAYITRAQEERRDRFLGASADDFHSGRVSREREKERKIVSTRARLLGVEMEEIGLGFFSGRRSLRCGICVCLCEE